MNHRTLIVVAIAWAVGSASCSSAAQGPRFAPARKTGTVETPLIKGASGIVVSRKNADVLWVHNDFAGETCLYAINAKGKLLSIWTVVGAKARNWEDIAAGPGPEPNQSYLYVGDIGDNNARYPSVQVYRVPEPSVDPNKPFSNQRTAAAETIDLIYPDGPRDAETLIVDPKTKDIYIIAKRELFCKVYMAAYPQSTTKPTALTRVAILPWALATGGDVSPDGRYVIVRSYYNASLWTRAEGEPLWKAFLGPRVDLPLASEPQGEAICFDSAGQGYFTISEMANPPVYYFERVGDKTDDRLSDNTPIGVESRSRP